ncbi:protein DMR6-LIKE OXYGENASE 2-like isoform X2 [Tripterygium wilfordii]|uniref:protein DMR6-LIKE OXYGENASE 2-like isoform X2 n=1 Tax=Tripterygium wilfordii TaxID=458696 RepID=UPI0018F82029|nr:protein DMR6-LIKE OXYGENASE 2-like isoform X2 [Tripterygium wilfordii]
MESTTSFQLASKTTLSLGPKFVLPEDKRPNLLQIINHGVPYELQDRMLSTLAEFFELPPEEKAQFFTTDINTKQVRLYNDYLKVDGQEKVGMWSESFLHPCHRLDDIMNLLPENPPQYREVIAEYSKAIHVLMKRLLSLISMGLGLEKDSLEKSLGAEKHILNAHANYYPPCPDPELTLGLPAHTDIGGLTVLLQPEGLTSLQVLKDGEWLAIHPIPNAFVINLADQTQVLSNGRYKSVLHRAVTNRSQRRVSLAIFCSPDPHTIISPIEDLIDEEHPRIYHSYRFAEFLQEFKRQEGTTRMVKECFQLTL